MKKSEMNEKEFHILLLRLLKYFRVIPTDIVFPHKQKAEEIMKLFSPLFDKKHAA